MRDICRSHAWLNPRGRLVLITVSDRATPATFVDYQQDLTAAFSALDTP
ncbi:MAG TPA: hypothetical protein DHW45_13905 [Candidatus Latescibacteria bacterium]|nr:hypothetical protein [Candidatus Latescibacterota bacterium]